MAAFQQEHSGERHRPERIGTFVYPSFPYVCPPEQRTGAPTRHKVAIIGGGLVGLSAATDLAARGIPALLLDDNNTVSDGSRSIAQAKRTMEIWNRIGCAAPIAQKGVGWSTGHIFNGGDRITTFELYPEGSDKYPAFTSVPQYYVESYIKAHGDTQPQVEFRWLNRVVDVRQHADHVAIEVETPDGRYITEAEWVIAADGVNSTMRRLLDLPFRGRPMDDRFVIADVKLPADFPTDRCFWFKPPFYDSNSALRVVEPDSVWRVDWQLAPEDDAEAERDPERVRKRLSAMFGADVDYEIQWFSIYSFGVRRIDRFRHGRIFFAGDAAHQLSPFGGGRGGNSGVQDVDNLVWKLAAVITGRAPAGILDSYDLERGPVADRNLRDSVRSTEFITPRTAHSLAIRDAVLHLAPAAPFAKAFVNTGRFAVSPILSASPLVTPDEDAFPEANMPGSPVADAPLVDQAGTSDWLVDHMGTGFTLMLYEETLACVDRAAIDELRDRIGTAFDLDILVLSAGRTDGQDSPAATLLWDRDGIARRRYGLEPGSCYLFRPDQHVCARWRRLDPGKVHRAALRSLGWSEGPDGAAKEM